MKLITLLMPLYLFFASNTVLALSAEETVRDTTGEVLAKLIAERERLKADPDHIRVLARYPCVFFAVYQGKRTLD